jgi:hypothetical protein
MTKARMGEALFGGPTHGARTACNVLRRNPDLHMGEALFCGNDLQLPTAAQRVPRAITNARMGEALSSREDLHTPRTARNFPRAITNARMGEALFGGPTHGARTNAVLRDAHLAWPPVWDGAS